MKKMRRMRRMNNLAEFKRYLARPDANIRMMSIEHLRNGEWVSGPVKYPDWRSVDKLQTNAVKFEGGSWLYFGKASEWAFDNASGIAVNLSGHTRLTYKWANVIDVLV
jgi:hypothetical protein